MPPVVGLGVCKGLVSNALIRLVMDAASAA